MQPNPAAESPQDFRAPLHFVLLALALVALCTPALLAFNLAPSATFLNQAAALVGWGAFIAVAVLVAQPIGSATLVGRTWPALAALLLMVASAVGAMVVLGLPRALGLSSLGLIFSTGLVLLVAANLRSQPIGEWIYGAFCLALLAAGVLSLLIALVQYFAPQWADGNVIARAATPGRAGGNLRQPNHLSSLLLWAMVALVWLHEAFAERSDRQALRVWRATTALALTGLTLGVVLTVSRTGTVCILLMALWGVLDKRLSKFSRSLLWLVPLVYVLCWLGVDAWARSGAHAFAGDSQLKGSDLSSSRFAIWANTIELIKQNPWWGVGWGEFNFAWTLTPFPGRPGAFFDHTHNLPLQLIVEMGIPMGTLVLALLAWALWKGFMACQAATAAESATVRSAFVMVLMMGVHSMLEYPLWYAYFLLPMAFALGTCLGSPGVAAQPSGLGLWLKRVLCAGSVLVVVVAAASVWDYWRVVSIFTPGKRAAPLEERIVRGQRSWFFAHHADYAAATVADHPSDAMSAFDRAPHYLLDTRLMQAWATALNERGDVERARYVAQRLREFRNPASDEFFAECSSKRGADKPVPFQCTAPSKPLGYTDFR